LIVRQTSPRLFRADVLAVVFGPDGSTVIRRDDTGEDAWSAPLARRVDRGDFMPALLIRTSRGPYRRRTRSAPAAPLPSSVTSRAAEQGGMAGGEKRAARPAAEPLLAPVIRVTGAEATSYSMTPRSPGGGADRPGFDRRTPTVIVSHTTPDDVPAGGGYSFVRSPREAAEVAIGLAALDQLRSGDGLHFSVGISPDPVGATIPRASTN
jgi:hypothetical protein